jgi:hypothetical protein
MLPESYSPNEIDEIIRDGIEGESNFFVKKEKKPTNMDGEISVSYGPIMKP